MKLNIASRGIYLGNLVAYPNDFKNSYWTAFCANTQTKGNLMENTYNSMAPDGTQTATQFDTDTTSGNGALCGTGIAWGVFCTVTPQLIIGQTYTASVWLKGETTDVQMIIGLCDPQQSQAIPITTSWAKYSYTAKFLGTQNRGLQFYCANGAKRYYAWNAQLILGELTTKPNPT